MTVISQEGRGLGGVFTAAGVFQLSLQEKVSTMQIDTEYLLVGLEG